MKDILLYIGGGILIVFILFFLLRFAVKKRGIVINSCLGILSLTVLNLLSGIIRFKIGFSILNVGVALILGMPGVALLVIEKFI